MRVVLERQVFPCPFCGAPNRESLPSDALLTKCKYCGAQVIVPRNLTGLTRRCSNHPEVMSIGLCGVCGQGFCEQCLRVYNWGVLELRGICSTCAKRIAKETGGSARARLRIWLASALIMLLAALPVRVFNPPTSGFLVVTGIFLMCVALSEFDTYTRLSRTPMVQTVEEMLKDQRMSMETVYGECPHCKASYFYSSAKIMSDRAVLCQNCDRPFNLERVTVDNP